ncbi:hypothetical protein IAU59_005230 [Kwoniella sp. CBS 9459]
MNFWDSLSRAQHGLPFHPTFGSPDEGFRERRDDCEQHVSPEEPSDLQEEGPLGIDDEEQGVETEEEAEARAQTPWHDKCPDIDPTIDAADTHHALPLILYHDRKVPEMAEGPAEAGSSAAGPSGAGTDGAETTAEDGSSFFPGDDRNYTVRGEERSTSPRPGEASREETSSGSGGFRRRVGGFFKRGSKGRTSDESGDKEPSPTFDDIANGDENLKGRIPPLPRGRRRHRADSSSSGRIPDVNGLGSNDTTEEEEIRRYLERRRRAMETEGTNPSDIEPHPLSSAWRHRKPPPKRLHKRHGRDHQAYVSDEEDEAFRPSGSAASATASSRAGGTTGPGDVTATAETTSPSGATVQPTEPISVTEDEADKSTGSGIGGWIRKGIDKITGDGDGETTKLTKPASTITVTGRPRKKHVWDYTGGIMPNLLEIGTQLLSAQSGLGWNSGFGTAGDPYSSLPGGTLPGQSTGLDNIPMWRLRQMAGLAPQTLGSQSQIPSYSLSSNPWDDRAAALSAFQNQFTLQTTSAPAMTDQERELRSVSNQLRQYRLGDGTLVTVSPGEVPLDKINLASSQSAATAPSNANSEVFDLISRFAAQTGQTFEQAAEMLANSQPG